MQIETLSAGGSFGRRIDFGDDMLAELVDVAKAIGPNKPVKLVWTREDDIQWRLLPAAASSTACAVRCKGGKIVAWSNTIVGQSAWPSARRCEAMVVQERRRLDHDRGRAETPYAAIADFRCDLHVAKTGVPTTLVALGRLAPTPAYAVECFIDELLDAAGKDPVAGRLGHDGQGPALRRCAEGRRRTAAPAGAPRRARPGARRRGGRRPSAPMSPRSPRCRCSENGEPRVHKVWCAVDCGVVVNPDIVRAQMEGGIGYGLGRHPVRRGPDGGGPAGPGNFDGYRSLRIQEMPEIEVIIDRRRPRTPTGVGEPGVPPIGAGRRQRAGPAGRERPSTLPMVKREIA